MLLVESWVGRQTARNPLATDQVMRIISRLEKGSLADVQVAVIFAMGFFGFLRCNDLSNVAVDDLLFPDSHVALFLLQRKNEQFREGSWLLMQRSEAAPCPVAVLDRFLDGQSFRGVKAVLQDLEHKERPGA